MTEETPYKTLYKTAYYYGKTLMQLYVNKHKETNDLFLLTFKGKYYYVYGAREEEKMKIIKAIMETMTPEQIGELYDIPATTRGRG